MAALAGGGIDNLLIEIEGPELPIMDGSAAPFVFLIECAGVVELEATRRCVKILRPVTLAAGGRSVALQPGDGFSIDFEVDYGAGAIARQRCQIDLVNGAFKNELSRARTFGFLHEVDALRAAGLARGASLENAVVVSHDGVLNEGGLRFPDEFVRHKVLDCARRPLSRRRAHHRPLRRPALGPQAQPSAPARAVRRRRDAWCWSDSDASGPVIARVRGGRPVFAADVFAPDPWRLRGRSALPIVRPTK